MNFNTEAKQTSAFLANIWGSETPTAFIGIKKPDGEFRNIAVKSVTDAIQIAQKFDAEGCDVYFSCATFKDHSCREGDNAECAYGYWLDLDCGEKKAASGEGYASKKEAWAALQKFIQQTGMPKVTALVDSGNGLHAYWMSADAIPATEWKAQAAKLKALTHHYGLLADDSRTADMASVLRVPGTFNFKTPETPKPVKLRYMQAMEVSHAE